VRPNGIEHHRFSEPGELKAVEPDLYCRAIPSGNGPFEIAATTVRMDSLALIMGCASPCLGFLRAKADSVALQLPIEQGDGLILDSIACQPGVLAAHSGGAELLWTNPRHSNFAVLALPFDEMEELLVPPVGSKLLQQGSLALLQTRPASWTRAEQIVRVARATTITAPNIFDAEQPRRALRDTLLEVAHDLVSPEPNTEIRQLRSSQARRRIVIAADEYLRTHVDRPIYTEELCDALAVSTSSLADAFRAVFCIRPHRFLKLRRMAMVRVALQSLEGPTPLVKSVALSHGFWHLGQFALDYRDTLGEMPSETLIRARR
jgi:AraC-like DNA-binding protein